MADVANLMIDYENKIADKRYFHVAFARLMELTNKINSSLNDDTLAKESQSLAFGFLLLGLYPYAPHLTSEIWADLNQGEDIQSQSIPNYAELLQ